VSSVAHSSHSRTAPCGEQRNACFTGTHTTDQRQACAAAGLMEITKLHERCLADRELRAATRNGEWLIALHSSLSSAEQQSVFERPPEGPRSLSADAALRMPGWRRVQA